MKVSDYSSTSKLHFSSECSQSNVFSFWSSLLLFIRMFTENDCFVYVNELNAILMLLEIIMHNYL